MTDEVLYEVGDGVALITLNRPEKLNAWTPAMSVCYSASLGAAAVDPDVRAVVVTGAGRGFCAGVDMERLRGLSTGEGEIGSHDRPPMELEPAVPKPVIAAINGPCAGMGFVRAMFCDIRIAAAGTKITTAFARRGMVAEYGISWQLPRVIGLGRALDVLLSGRVLLAEEALELGIVNRVADTDVLAVALEYAQELATYSSPAAMRDIKGQVWADATGTLEQSWARSRQLMQEAVARPDVQEGMLSYREGRVPRFPALEP